MNTTFKKANSEPSIKRTKSSNNHGVSGRDREAARRRTYTVRLSCPVSERVIGNIAILLHSFLPCVPFHPSFSATDVALTVRFLGGGGENGRATNTTEREIRSRTATPTGYGKKGGNLQRGRIKEEKRYFK